MYIYKRKSFTNTQEPAYKTCSVDMDSSTPFTHLLNTNTDSDPQDSQSQQFPNFNPQHYPMNYPPPVLPGQYPPNFNPFAAAAEAPEQYVRSSGVLRRFPVAIGIYTRAAPRHLAPASCAGGGTPAPPLGTKYLLD
ncbi:hypothetical protein EJB05_29599 [Eragrostis curvula]|uniref:Uncharacterized protein n=1 Tax=Eragrostis curvula TaxID=38414 RepID=A0A5J9UUQ3_9POAL|nr:hypothetical protein EJB05_29599 [Eragrostis curvula]